MHVVVVGAGIGGLCTALSLHRAGIKVTVLEAVRQPSALGVGINLQPHAVRELDELGLGDELAQLAIETEEFIHTDQFGNHIWSEPRGRARGYRWPQYAIHRGILQMLLLDTVIARLGADSVRLGAKLERVDEHRNGVTAVVRVRDTNTVESVMADALVGADGLHSTVREQFHGKSPLNHVGVHMWRGLAEMESPLLSGRSMVIVGSTKAPRFVAYPIPSERASRGKSLVNWLAEIPVPSGNEGQKPEWDFVTTADDVLTYFEHWGPDWLDAAGLIRNSPEVLSYPMVDRDPLPHWGSDRVTLLGDAAHPLIPVGSNGGSQAIIDARVLALCLATSADVVTGLSRYEDARRETTNALVLATRSNPPDELIQLVESRAPHGFENINEVLTADELEQLSRTYERISHSDIEMLNNRASWDPPRTSHRLTRR